MLVAYEIETTTLPSLQICVAFGRWGGGGVSLFLHSLLVGEGILKRHPSSCTKEDLREAERGESFFLVKLLPDDKSTDVMA